ncbi:hypothetical protein MLD38_011296 [Melastoma candidum]|uniref:Uncharacterized protein n=1 Tax=Melastoma candidum TaxID=119954 RepID=A0ACB9R286_9MYRT|nr:hypothetical protein MLD38_011296 [Melastoma candidum]
MRFSLACGITFLDISYIKSRTVGWVASFCSKLFLSPKHGSIIFSVYNHGSFLASAADCNPVHRLVPLRGSLRHGFYSKTCPDIEKIVSDAVAKKCSEIPTARANALRILIHDCFVEGCDASTMISSNGT